MRRAYYSLASILYEEKRLADAAEYFGKTILLSPDSEQAYYDLASAQMSLNKNTEGPGNAGKSPAKIFPEFRARVHDRHGFQPPKRPIPRPFSILTAAEGHRTGHGAQTPSIRSFISNWQRLTNAREIIPSPKSILTNVSRLRPISPKRSIIWVTCGRSAALNLDKAARVDRKSPQARAQKCPPISTASGGSSSNKTSPSPPSRTSLRQPNSRKNLMRPFTIISATSMRP